MRRPHQTGDDSGPWLLDRAVQETRRPSARRRAPKPSAFPGENFQKNLDLVKKIEQLATAKGCTPSQLALAWVLAQGNDIVPIPSTKRVKYLDENLGAIHVRLISDELAQIDAVMPVGATSVERYHAQAMKAIDR